MGRVFGDIKNMEVTLQVSKPCSSPDLVGAVKGDPMPALGDRFFLQLGILNCLTLW
jgi:hypothetical protein